MADAQQGDNGQQQRQPMFQIADPVRLSVRIDRYCCYVIIQLFPWWQQQQRQQISRTKASWFHLFTGKLCPKGVISCQAVLVVLMLLKDK